MKEKGASGVAWLSVGFVAALGGLAVSSALVVDYLRPRPVFCAEGGGCEAVRRTVFAAPLGVPLPVVGLAGFLAIGVLLLLPGPRARVAHLVLSLGAGVVGLGLFAVQLRLGEICPYCCAADACGVLGAAAACGRRWLAGPQPVGVSAALALAGAGALSLAAALPLYFGFRATPVPAAIRAEMAGAPPGSVTIVDFVDFECPFCRMTHAALAPLLEAHRDRVRLVRLQVPLRIHPHALDAARAACCGEQLGRGDAMAAALFTAPVEDLTRDGCERIAGRVGLPLDSYRACVEDPSTQAHIEQDRAKFKAAGGYALPTLWIGSVEMVGVQSGEVLATAIQDALARAGS